MPHVSVVLPVYDEIRTLPGTVAALQRVLDETALSYEVIIVESNSRDGTKEFVQQLEGTFIKIFQDRPRGKGNAVRAGLKAATGEIVAIYDGDDEYDPRDLATILEKFKDPDVTFVLGSRHHGASMRVMENHWIRANVMNGAHEVFTFMINVLFGVSLRDPFTMYKVFRRRVFENIVLTSDRFDLDWEIVCKAIRLGAVPIEVPVRYRSRDFSEGKKIRIFYDPLTWMVVLLKCRLLPIRRISS